MAGKLIILMCWFSILISTEIVLNAAAVPIRPEETTLNEAQTTGAIELAEAIINKKLDAVPQLFAHYFTQGILIYKNSAQAIKLTRALDTSVRTILKAMGDESLESLQNPAGQKFIKIINWRKKELQTSLGMFEEIPQSILQIAEFLPDLELLHLSQTSHKMHAALLPLLQKKFDTVNHWKNNEIIPVFIWKTDGKIQSVAFSHDGTFIASEGYEPVIRIWNVKTGKQINQINKNAENHTAPISFSPQKNLLAFALNDYNINIFDADKNTIIRSKRIISSPITTLAFSPIENILAVGYYNGTIAIWNINNDQITAFQAHEGEAASIAFFPDGSKFVSSGGDNNYVKIWDTKTRNLINKLHKFTTEVTVSPDNETIALIDKMNVLLWNIATDKKVTLSGSRAFISSMAFSPDGTVLISGSGEEIRLWAVGLAKQIKSIESGVSNVTFSPDGNLIATGADGNVKLWKAKAAVK